MFTLLEKDLQDEILGGRDLVYWDVRGRDLEADTLTAIGAFYDERYARWTDEVTGWKSEVEKASVDEFSDFVGSKFDQIVPRSLSMPPPDHDGMVAPAT